MRLIGISMSTENYRFLAGKARGHAEKAGMRAPRSLGRESAVGSGRGAPDDKSALWKLSWRICRLFSYGRPSPAVAKIAGTLSAAAFALAGVADGASPNGGFLYSEYLLQADVAPGAGSFIERGGQPFEVSVARPFYAAGADNLSAAAKDEFRDFSFSSRALDQAFGGRSSDIETDMRIAGWDLAGVAGTEAMRAVEEEIPAVRNAGFEVQSKLSGRRANVALYALGAVAEDGNTALAWEFRGFQAENQRNGVNAGFLLRGDHGNAMAGVNAFADYERVNAQDFWRWSAGGEWRSPWLDAFANYYKAITDRRYDGGEFSYTADGYDVEIHIHSPARPWVSGAIGYYSWDGEGSRGGSDGLRGGIKFAPENLPLAGEIEYSDALPGEHEVGGRLMVFHEFGRPEKARVPLAPPEFRRFNGREWFFAPAEREHMQRIYDAAPLATPGVWHIVGITGTNSNQARRAVFQGDGVAAIVTQDSGGLLGIEGFGVSLTGVAPSWPIPLRDDLTVVAAAGVSVMLSVSGGGEVRIGGSAALAGEEALVILHEGGEVRVAARGGVLALRSPRRGSDDLRIAGSAVLDVVSVAADIADIIVIEDAGNVSGADCGGVGGAMPGFRIVCSLEGFFRDAAGRPVEEELVVESAPARVESTVATLRARGGSGAYTYRVVASTGLALVTQIVGEHVVGEVILPPDSGQGDHYRLEVEISDLASAGAPQALVDRTKNLTVTLRARVVGVDYGLFGARFATEEGGRLESGATMTLTASGFLQTPVAQLRVFGGSGSLTASQVSPDTGGLMLIGNDQIVAIPAVGRSAGDVLSLVIEVSEADLDSVPRAPVRATLFVEIASVRLDVASEIYDAAGELVFGTNRDSPLVAPLAATAVLVASVSADGGTGSYIFGRVSGDREISVSSESGRVFLLPGRPENTLLSAVIEAADTGASSGNSANGLHTLYVRVDYAPLSLRLDADPGLGFAEDRPVVAVSPDRDADPLPAVTLVIEGGSGAENLAVSGAGAGLTLERDAPDSPTLVVLMSGGLDIRVFSIQITARDAGSSNPPLVTALYFRPDVATLAVELLGPQAGTAIDPVTVNLTGETAIAFTVQASGGTEPYAYDTGNFDFPFSLEGSIGIINAQDVQAGRTYSIVVLVTDQSMDITASIAIYVRVESVIAFSGGIFAPADSGMPEGFAVQADGFGLSGSRFNNAWKGEGPISTLFASAERSSSHSADLVFAQRERERYQGSRQGLRPVAWALQKSNGPKEGAASSALAEANQRSKT